jgi:hypothetical protein
MLGLKRTLPIAIVAVGMASTALAQDLQFTIVNDSDYTIVEVAVSPAELETWETLGMDALEEGYVGNVLIANGSAQCRYDMRMVFDDGEVLQDTVNMCEMGTYTIN